jgi:hypothetical protein
MNCYPRRLPGRLDRHFDPIDIAREHRIDQAIWWISKNHSELVDLPGPRLARQVSERFGLSLADTAEALRAASAARNGGW